MDVQVHLKIVGALVEQVLHGKTAQEENEFGTKVIGICPAAFHSCSRREVQKQVDCICKRWALSSTAATHVWAGRGTSRWHQCLRFVLGREAGTTKSVLQCQLGTQTATPNTLICLRHVCIIPLKLYLPTPVFRHLSFNTDLPSNTDCQLNCIV